MIFNKTYCGLDAVALLRIGMSLYIVGKEISGVDHAAET